MAKFTSHVGDGLLTAGPYRVAVLRSLGAMLKDVRAVIEAFEARPELFKPPVT